MRQIVLLVFFFCVIADACLFGDELDYENCRSIEDAIELETKEIESTSDASYEELAQLYVSRGESYLLNAQYEQAAEDFQYVDSLLRYFENMDEGMVVAFRSALGQVISYDNLGMEEAASEALQDLQSIEHSVGCDDCKEHLPCQGNEVLSSHGFLLRSSGRLHTNNKNSFVRGVQLKAKNNKQNNPPPNTPQDTYNDILGPDQPPEPGWCEEVVTGVGRAMDGIACLARSHAIKATLIGIIESLITRGVKCCQTGEFWKACVAPITRKWREWNNNKNQSLPPNEENLSLYINGGIV